MVAAAVGSKEFMQLLLKNKTIDFEVKDSSGINAFWVACFYGHGSVMSLLANKGIDVLASNETGTNALHLAV